MLMIMIMMLIWLEWDLDVIPIDLLTHPVLKMEEWMHQQTPLAANGILPFPVLYAVKTSKTTIPQKY